jgi:hypothetical protein
MGVGMTTLKGESLGAKARRGSAKQEEREKSHRRLSFALFVLGALVVAALFVVGADYYRIEPSERLHHAAHRFLKPAGPWGHGVGIVATMVMLSNLIYAVRKRWERLKGFSTIRTWLTFHQFVGFLSPLVIVFHAAFQSKNHLATLTAAALSVVVLTGIVGRFIYGLVPSGEGKAGELDELSRRWHKLSERLGQAASNLTSPDKLADLIQSAVSPLQQASLGAYLAQMPRQRVNDARDLSKARKLFQSPAHAREFNDSFKRLRKLQAQVSFYRSLKTLLAAWRVFHVVLAILLVILIAAHIGVSLFLGYRWIFT